MLEAKTGVIQANFAGASNKQKLELPNNTEAEEAIIGAILLDPEAIGRVVDLLVLEAFYFYPHRIIYEAALALFSSAKEVDLMSVTSYLIDHEQIEKIGGMSKLAELAEATVSAVNVDRFAGLVLEKYQRRKLIQAGRRIADLGFEGDRELEEVLDESEREIFEVTQESQNQDVEAPLDILLRIYQNAGIRQTGMSTGLSELNGLIGGLKRKKLYIIGGRSGMGKTHFMIHLASIANTDPSEGAIVAFSAEMDRDAWMIRLAAYESVLDSQKILEGRISKAEDFTALGEAVSALADAPLYIDDTPGSALTPVRMRSSIRRATALYGKPKLVVLDYLQLLGTEDVKTNRVSELDKIVNACKGIAKEFDVPFVALAQINRGVEGRNDKRPMISDLRESGAIEQAADVVMLLYRDEYYDPETDDPGICEIIVGKNRDGSTGTIESQINLETSRFSDTY